MAMILFVFGIFFIVMAVEKNTTLREAQMEEVNETTWHFIGTSSSEGEFADSENWEEGASSSCSTEGDKPCEISVAASSKSELSSYLSGMTNEQVLEINEFSRRN